MCHGIYVSSQRTDPPPTTDRTLCPPLWGRGEPRVGRRLLLPLPWTTPLPCRRWGRCPPPPLPSSPAAPSTAPRPPPTTPTCRPPPTYTGTYTALHYYIYITHSHLLTCTKHNHSAVFLVGAFFFTAFFQLTISFCVVHFKFSNLSIMAQKLATCFYII